MDGRRIVVTGVVAAALLGGAQAAVAQGGRAGEGYCPTALFVAGIARMEPPPECHDGGELLAKRLLVRPGVEASFCDVALFVADATAFAPPTGCVPPFEPTTGSAG